ncbi:MAG: hypothetical protein RBR53_03425 [Desulforegulaceae bacterium]|nr:hypothetical protein [Desulforegulaceae bacterium]
MKTNIYITVDTETSIGGAFSNPLLKPVGKEKRIYGKIAGEHYGIPLIMDIADSYGLKITFFVEVLNHYYFGKEDNYEVCQYILKRGHDVQLHLHPNYLNFKLDEPQKLIYSDNMYDYDLDTQVELIKEGKELLKEFGVNNPVAFRAGNYGFNLDTLKALKENSFLYDSSYSFTFCSNRKDFFNLFTNDVVNFNNIYEFPITNFLPLIYKNSIRTRPLDINAAGFDEMKKVLLWANDTKIKNITIIMHSFSFINSMDIQYANCKPRKIIISRFKKLCDFLSLNKFKYNVSTFEKINMSELLNNQDFESFFKMPLFPTVKRMAEQLL